MAPVREYCVQFPDRTGDGHEPVLPIGDDVLAKWMTLRADEDRLLAFANVCNAGCQIPLEPDRARPGAPEPLAGPPRPPHRRRRPGRRAHHAPPGDHPLPELSRRRPGVVRLSSRLPPAAG